MTGIFTISLDFELHWGVFDKRERASRKACYNNTLKLIPDLLKEFSNNEVHVTWATVGALFAHDENSFRQLQPAAKPSYRNPVFSAYEYAEKHTLKSEFSWAHFAPESIHQILQHEGQELGTHTFGHYYCMEPGQTTAEFAADLDAAIAAAETFGEKIRSLVFPRNQFNQDVLGTCYEKGITSVRSNPDTWFWAPVAEESTGILRKVFRTGDGYLPISKRTSYPLSSIRKTKNEPLQLPASRLLRSWNPKYNIANTLHMRRVLTEMTVAAEKNECYHLWWHPENFGDYPSQNMENLAVILTHYRKLVTKYGMTSWNMGEYADAIL